MQRLARELGTRVRAWFARRGRSDPAPASFEVALREAAGRLDTISKWHRQPIPIGPSASRHPKQER